MTCEIVLNRLKKARYKKNHHFMLPHDLTINNLTNLISICKFLLKGTKIEPFLKRLIKIDENWIMYDNKGPITGRKYSNWSKMKLHKGCKARGLTLRKVMFCMWDDSSLWVAANLYCKKLERSRHANAVKRLEFINRKGYPHPFGSCRIVHTWIVRLNFSLDLYRSLC